jgi:hypothetical protein
MTTIWRIRKMTKTRNKSSVAVAYKEIIGVKTGKKIKSEVLYLSSRDEERGEDIRLNSIGYKVEAL